MADTVQQLVDDVRVEGAFDVTPEQALRWLTRRHRKMVARARCYRKTVSIGPTVADQRDYALPEGVVQLFELTVDGVTYGNGRHADLAQGAQGYLLLSDSGGVVVAEEDEAGASEVALYPTPTTAGSEVLVRATFLPPDLDVADDSTLKIPGDFTDALVAGAIATGLRRVEHRSDLAQPHEQEFADACEELRRQVNRRYRGPGPAQIRVVGYNA